MVSISAAAPGAQQTSASACAARVAGGTGACEAARRRSFPSRALLQHASVAGGGGGGGGAGQQRSSLQGKPAQPCRADACLVVGRWLRRRRASSTSVHPRRRPSRRSPRRPSPSRPAPTTREKPPLNPSPNRGGSAWRVCALAPARLPMSAVSPRPPLPCAAPRRTSRPRATASALSSRSSRR